MPITYHLSDFDGPLDLLLSLIHSAKINIRDVFVSDVTGQYITFVQNADDVDMDDVSAFLAMAATLVEIKSRALLPKPPKEDEDEEDPEQALIRQLEEYAAFRALAADMQGFEKAAALLYHKLPEEYPLPPPAFELTNLTLDGLMAALSRVLSRKDEEPREESLSQRRILRDEYTIPHCMARILRKVSRAPRRFDELFTDEPTKSEAVTLFLALLELLRLGRVRAEQDGVYGDILISVQKEGNESHAEQE